MKKNERVPDWWREFWSILCSRDEHCTNDQIKRLACQQAVAFRLLSFQLEKGGWWSVPPCLGVLRRKDNLPLKEFQGVQDYWVAQREEMVALAMALERCTVWSRMPQGYYVEQYRSSVGASPLWLSRAICETSKCWMWQIRTLCLLLSLQRGPHHQNPEQKSQSAYLPLTSCPLWSPRRLLTQKNWPLCRGEDHWHLSVYPFMGRQVWLIPPRGCSLSGKYTHWGPVGPELFGHHAGNSLS